jgi:hypothetical protein
VQVEFVQLGITALSAFFFEVAGTLPWKEVETWPCVVCFAIHIPNLQPIMSKRFAANRVRLVDTRHERKWCEVRVCRFRTLVNNLQLIEHTHLVSLGISAWITHGTQALHVARCKDGGSAEEASAWAETFFRQPCTRTLDYFSSAKVQPQVFKLTIEVNVRPTTALSTPLSSLYSLQPPQHIKSFFPPAMMSSGHHCSISS